MGGNLSTEKPVRSMSRNSSGNDLQKHIHKQFLPHEKLAKLLTERSVGDIQKGGIKRRIFVRLVFPAYTDLGLKLFSYLLLSGGGDPTSEIISEHDFVQEVEKMLSTVEDKKIIQMYVSMYGTENQNGVTPKELFELLMIIYKISMDHYPEGPQSCRYIFATIQAVVDSVFHKKSVLSVGYVSSWLDEHCPRLVGVLHRYVVHILSTSHRSIGDDIEGTNSGNGIELTTPVLEKTCSGLEKDQRLLPVSQVWILACSLPQLYTKPSSLPISPISANKQISSTHLLMKLLDVPCPSHWTLLYNSNQHGLGSNRFVYHVSSYRGPTLIFLRGEQGVEFCLGTPDEWKESHLYWGGDDSVILQILPKYQILLKKGKSMYMNLSIRGYPLGIRGGSDPRKPIIEVNPAFTSLTYSGIPYQLESVEAWGCGNPQLREAQLDIKKWEGKEIEKARKVKISADDWIDHPDRYLLELAGRQSYNTST